MSETHALLYAVQIQHPGGKDRMWRASCSCGGYTSGVYAYPGHAEQAVRQHVAAKAAR